MWIQEAQKMADKETEQIKKLNQTVHSKDTRERDQAYNEYVKQVTPVHNTWKNLWRAFLVGGLICMLGQVFTSVYMSFGIEKESAAAWTTLSLIGLSVILTGFHVYQKIVKFGGAGALVPITGFANSVVSPAIEYKAEGHVFGIGCKIFTIAGPVILYGIFASWVLGMVKFFWRF